MTSSKLNLEFNESLMAEWESYKYDIFINKHYSL